MYIYMLRFVPVHFGGCVRERGRETKEKKRKEERKKKRVMEGTSPEFPISMRRPLHSLLLTQRTVQYTIHGTHMAHVRGQGRDCAIVCRTSREQERKRDTTRHHQSHTIKQPPSPAAMTRNLSSGKIQREPYELKTGSTHCAISGTVADDTD